MDILTLIRGILGILLIYRLINKSNDDEKKGDQKKNSDASDENSQSGRVEANSDDAAQPLDERAVSSPSDGFIVLNNKIIAYVGNDKNVVVPEGITEIKAYAFAFLCLDRIVLPSTITNFENQHKLTVEELDMSKTTLTDVDLGGTCLIKRLKPGQDNDGSVFEVIFPPCPDRRVDDTPQEEYSKDFIVLDNKLIAYVGNGVDIIVPEGIQEIKKFAFYNQNVGRIVTPSSLRVFEEQSCLTVCKLDLSRSSLDKICLRDSSVMELVMPQ